jgi:RNA polymerase sigma factor (sigma-70 family)
VREDRTMMDGLKVASLTRTARNDDTQGGRTDEELLERFIGAGDVGAYTAMVVRHGPRVLGVCRGVLRRQEDVEDTFQATFLMLARNASKIRRRASLGHWLHGVAHRLAVRSKVKASRREARKAERRGVAMAVQDPGDDLDRRETRQIVHEEIDRLPERLRQPILLCYLEGHTNEAAARLLDCPTSTFKERLAKGREVLRGRLARRGLALSAALLFLLLPRTSTAERVPRELVDSTVRLATTGLQVWHPRRPARARARHPNRLVWVAVAVPVATAIATAALYVTSAEKVGFFTWLSAAIRRACH